MAEPQAAVLFESHLLSLPLVARGKVRDIYAVGEQHLLVVTTDRLSAFDVVLPTAIPGKGSILNQLSIFWMRRFEELIPNHLTDIAPESVVSDSERVQVTGRSVVVKRLQALPIEAVVRGYLEGSGWKEYQMLGTVCGLSLPTGLVQAARLQTPLFTPATKATVGEHDENIGFDRVEQLIGSSLAQQVRRSALALYERAAEHALKQGIIIADSKFEFGIDPQGTLTLIDEALTPDSSRFWPQTSYQPGSSPPSFDKQYIRNWLEQIGWNKRPPAPPVPEAVVAGTVARYREAAERLMVP